MEELAKPQTAPRFRTYRSRHALELSLDGQSNGFLSPGGFYLVVASVLHSRVSTG
jgi:hypothetical protein